MRRAFFTAGATLLLAFSCGTADEAPPTSSATAAGTGGGTGGTGGQDAGPVLPPRICKPPAAVTNAWFEDVTTEVGLAQTASYQPVGTCLVSADFDGDGFPDLVSFRGESTPGLVMGQRVRFLMMNRPSKSDPKARVLEDVPDQAGLLETRSGSNDRGASIALVGDLDNDGDVDLITCPADFTSNAELRDPCAAFLNDGKGHFKLAPPSELETPGPAASAVLFDFDGDGILDFSPAPMAHWPYGPPGSKWKHGPRIFKGKGDGTFTEVTKDVGLPTKDGALTNGTQFRHSLAMTECDIDGDGDQDLIIASYGREENQVWRNDGGKFVEVGHALGLDHDDREDFSDDESYRCYCAANAGVCMPNPPAPKLDCMAFGGPYLRGWVPYITEKSFSLGGNNMGVTCADVDDDGDMDVVFATIVHGDVGSSSDPTELILNPGDGGKFTRPGNDKTGLERKESGLYWNHGDNMPFFFDLDLDGRKDFYLTSTVYPGSHPWLWHQKADGKFEEIGAKSGLLSKGKPVAQGVTFVDLDGDGDLDLLTGTTAPDDNAALHAWRNKVGQDANFARVKLVGLGAGHSNVSAIGARVRVTAGGRTQTQEVKGGQGIGASQSDFALTFGLGAACDIDTLEVRWPDGHGTISRFDGVRANYVLTIREGEGAIDYH